MDTSTYEQLKDGDFIPADAREAWMRLDQHRHRLVTSAERILQDADTTPEAKQRYAEELYAEDGPKIALEAKALRKRLIGYAESAEKSSIPLPSGESLNPEDPTKVLIGQNEAARIHRRIERAQTSSKGPFVSSTSDILKGEYEKALEMAGTRGGAIVRGCLMVAEELGIGTDWLPRGERHAESLDRARRLWYAADAISTKAPELPKSFKKNAARTTQEQRGSLKPLVLPARGARPILKARGGGG